MAALPGAAISQVSVAPATAPRASTHTLSVRVDNDAFDFWRLPWNRPDEEYTSGVHVTYDGGGAPWWAPAAHSGDACFPGAIHCHTSRVEIGQDIYTPKVSHVDDRAAVNSRPNAGWLYVSQTARALRIDRSDAVTIAVGVTGPPSLAQVTQRIAHSAAPRFNRPTDWTRQINFEPGIIARYEQQRRAAIGSGSGLGFDVIPHASASLGNVATAADAGLQMRSGWNLPHPWLPTTGGLSIALMAGVTGRAVARDIFLDGNTFRDSPRVGHNPFIASGEAGLTLAYRGATAAYRVLSESRSYAAGPVWHPWGSLVGGFTVSR
jgi:lipid A 3-O-deacylase